MNNLNTGPGRIKCYPNPILRQKSRPVLLFQEETKDTIERLKMIVNDESMVESEGLAAVQVGSLQRIFLVEMDNKDQRIFVNPSIVEYLGENIVTTEGCLSIPVITARLKCRNTKIRVSSQNEFGDAFTEEILEGREAVVYAHELDHLEGVLLFDQMGPAQRRMKKTKYKKAPKKSDIKIKKITRAIRD